MWDQIRASKRGYLLKRALSELLKSHIATYWWYFKVWERTYRCWAAKVQSFLFCFHVAQMLNRDSVMSLTDVQWGKDNEVRRGDGKVGEGSGGEKHKQVDRHEVRVRGGVWLLANREFAETASTSGLISECCPVGEEGPHWCLPARFYSGPSISMWASHRLPLLLLAFHHSSVPSSVLPSSVSSTCVCVCVCVWMFQEPSWLCRQWEER